MSLNGELYFRRALYRSDFTVHHLAQHLFIHEMAHVWQHQRGMWVGTRGLLSWAGAINIGSIGCCCVSIVWNSKHR